jgi:ATP-dependent helicase/nuclease subunit A
VVREVIEEGLAVALERRRDADWLYLAARGVGPRELELALSKLLESEDAPVRLAAQDEDHTAAFCEGFRRAAGSLAVAGSPLVRGIAGAVIETARVSASSSAALAEWAEAWEPRFVKRLGEWSRGVLLASERQEMGDDPAALFDAAARLLPQVKTLQRFDAERFAATRRVLADLSARVEERLRSRGVATFDALLRETRALLGNNSTLRRHWQERIDQILVDEFQDTDPVQCEILQHLALDSKAASRPGLFVVGDPKQSIYAFRSADLRAYERFAEGLLAHGGTRLALVVNFRSVPPILEEVEQIVGRSMQAASGRQPAFETLLPAKAIDTGEVPVEHWILWDAEAGVPRAEDASRLEARAVAADVVRENAAGTAWSQMALLVRTSRDLDLYLDALRDRGVPYQLAREPVGAPRREISDALALLRCVFDPGDRFALVTWLRSAWVGVPDAALYPLFAAGLPGAFRELRAGAEESIDRVEEIVAQVASEEQCAEEPGWAHALRFGLRAIACAREEFPTKPPEVFVEDLRRRFPIDAMTAGFSQGAHRMENLSRLLDRFETLLAESPRPPIVAIDELERMLTRPDDAEEESPRAAEGDAVTISTIHGAKGLDWEVVYLLRTQRGTPNSSPDTRLGKPGEASGMRLVGAPNLLDWHLDLEREETEAAEQVRLLYVAMTRAKRRLVTSGVWPANPPATPLQARGLADLIAMGDVPTSDELIEGQRASAESGRDRFAAGPSRVFVFPALATVADVDLQPGVSERASPALAELRAAAHQLEARRREAASRAERPLVGIASNPVEGGGLEAGDAPLWVARRRAGERSLSRADALAVGEAAHAALESLERGDDTSVLRRLREAGHRVLDASLPGDDEGEAKAELDELLENFAAGPLFERFCALLPHIVARELPMIAPPDAEESALCAISGAIDLLYRDAEGRFVVADFKTDRVAPGREEEATQHYRRQGEIYVRAVRDALGLEAEPRFELWWLPAGSAVRSARPVCLVTPTAGTCTAPDRGDR